MIENQEQLKQAFSKIDALIYEGFEGNKEKEHAFLVIAKAIEYYEDHVLKLMTQSHPDN